MAPTGKVVVACPFCDTRNSIEVARQGQGPKCASCKKPYHLDRPIQVHEKDFDETVLNAGVPVLVDFYADWCNPCRAMAPALDQIAEELAGKALVVKVNTDAAPAVSQRYGVRSIPYFAGFSGGEMTGTLVGMQTRDALKKLANVQRSTSNVQHQGNT
jgi:thioredoxin 2